MHALLRASLGAGVAAAVAPIAAGQAPPTLLALSGTQVPGAPPGVVYGYPSTPSVDRAGHAVFETAVSGPVGSDAAIMGPGAGGATTMIVQRGGQAPGFPAGTPVYITGLDRLSASGDGALAFYGGVPPYGGVVWWPGPSGLVPVARGFQAAPGVAGYVFEDFGMPRLDEQYPRLVFVGDLTDISTEWEHRTGVWKVGTAGVLSLVVVDGQAAPGTESVFAGFIDCLMSGGRICFTAELDSGAQSVWMTEAGVPALRFRQGDAVPGSPGLVLGTPDVVRSNAAGRVVVRANIRNESNAFVADALWVTDVPGDLRPLVRSGTQAPGLEAGTAISGIGQPFLNAAGQVMLYTNLDEGPGGANGLTAGAIWIADSSGRLVPIARVGSRAPTGDTFRSLRPLAFNSLGQAVFLASTGAAGGAWHPELWSFDPGRRLVRLAAAGDAVTIAPGDVRNFYDFMATSDSGGQDGLPNALNDRGDFVFVGTFAPSQRGIGIFRTTLTAGCYANCDGSTAPPVLNAADFNCFLARYAANDPWANCDQSGIEPVVNVADFVCFQVRFAGGCR